jgi:hypothetical protein
MKSLTRTKLKEKLKSMDMGPDIDEDMIYQVTKVIITLKGYESALALSIDIIKVVRREAMKRKLWKDTSKPNLPDWPIELPESWPEMQAQVFGDE